MSKTSPRDGLRQLSDAATKDLLLLLAEAFAVWIGRKERKRFRKILKLLIKSKTADAAARAEAGPVALSLFSVADTLDPKMVRER